MQVEVATTRDVDRLADLWVALATDQRRYGSHLAAEGNRTTMHRAIASAVVDERIVVVRADDGEEDGEGDGEGEDPIRGFVMFMVEYGLYDQDVIRGRIQNLYVEPAFRGRGYGSALLERAEAALAGRGADVITIEAMADNHAARTLYERHGFEPHRIEFEQPVEIDEGMADSADPSDGGERKR